MEAQRKKPMSSTERMAAYRKRMRAAGLRPVQLWLPDTKDPKFVAELRRQARTIAASDPAGEEAQGWIDELYELPDDNGPDY